MTSLPENSNWNNDFFDKSRNNRPNEDPGVNSDDEDDMFQFEPLSHRSSQSSLATGRLGAVSAVVTPCQGSIESLAIQLGKPNELDRELYGDWDAKLLGNKKKPQPAEPYTINTEHDDTISVASLQSRASTQLSMAASQVTTPDTWTPHTEDLTGSMSSLPSYNEVC